jgi:2-methylfumaryl-CoA isomerase
VLGALPDAAGRGGKGRAAGPLFAEVEHPGGGRYATPGALGRLADEPAGPPQAAPRLGEHTDEILAEDLGLSSGEIARLHDSGIVAAAEARAVNVR